MKWLLAATGGIGLVLLVQLVVWDALRVSCGEDVLSEQQSPDGAYAYTLHRRNCGATTDYATALTIRHAADVFGPSVKEEILLISGDVPVIASWMGNDRLEVHVPKRVEIFKRAETWDGVAISYVWP